MMEHTSGRMEREFFSDRLEMFRVWQALSGSQYYWVDPPTPLSAFARLDNQEF